MKGIREFTGNEENLHVCVIDQFSGRLGASENSDALKKKCNNLGLREIHLIVPTKNYAWEESSSLRLGRDGARKENAASL